MKMYFFKILTYPFSNLPFFLNFFTSDQKNAAIYSCYCRLLLLYEV